jgi:hypothetical protein
MLLENSLNKCWIWSPQFGPKRDEARGGWKKLHDEELHNFSKYDCNDQVEKDGWAGHVARMGIRRRGRKRMHIGYLWESNKERDHWEVQDVGGWKTLDSREIGCDGMD